MISNFVLRQESEESTIEPTGQQAEASYAKENTGFMQYFNNKESPEATRIKKCVMSYDLLAYVSFNMLYSFEQLIFDSNVKNMARSMRFYRINQKAQVQIFKFFCFDIRQLGFIPKFFGFRVLDKYHHQSPFFSKTILK